MVPGKTPSRPVTSPSRRLTSRVPAPGDVWVYGQCHGREDVSRVRNMSMGGLFIETPEPRAEGVLTFSGTKRADPGRCRREACKIRCWIGIEIHGPERAGPAETGHTADQTPQDQSGERKIVIQSSGVMISTTSFERRTGTNSKSTRSRQWSAHSSNKRSSPHSIN